MDVLLREGADEATVGMDDKRSADVIGVVSPEDELVEDVERVHGLLTEAPANRAWRRRG